MAQTHFVAQRLLLVVISFVLGAYAGWGTDDLSTESREMVVLDLRRTLEIEFQDEERGYDAAKAVGALQGIVNRDAPRLFVVYLPNRMALERGLHLPEPCLDLYWLHHLREEGRFLAERSIRETTDVWEALAEFLPELEGLVLWDEKVPATANVASTVAGADRLLPVRASDDENSFHQELMRRFRNVEVKVDLRERFTGSGKIPGTDLDSTGSAKCDAYLWAVKHYLETGRCGSTHLAYYIDGVDWKDLAPDAPPFRDFGNLGLFNADYWIAKKAFFFDLCPWLDVSASDDPGQPVGTDGRTLRAILEAANRRNNNEQVIVCGGFVPWWIKYTNFRPGKDSHPASSHEPVATEWHLADVLSAYNTVMDADAAGLIGLANASIYRLAPLDARYDQNPLPASIDYDPDKTYILFAMLDYDSAAWLAQAHPFIWRDPNRGRIPLLWGINPILAERVPMVFESIFSELSPNDRIGADEGLGYINPNLLGVDRKHSDLPDGRETYLKAAKEWFDRFDMKMTAFVITAHEGPANAEALELLAELSPGGVGFQGGDRIRDGAYHGVGFKQQEEDWPLHLRAGTLSEKLEYWVDRKGPGEFLFFRCILVTPAQIVEAVDRLRVNRPDLNFEIPDPAAYFDLLKRVRGD